MRGKQAGKFEIELLRVKMLELNARIERSEPENYSNWTVACEASGKFFENFALLPQILVS